MGKPKLLSSIRALHEALSSIKTSSILNCSLCVHQIQTDSFRFVSDDVFKSFNSIYIDDAGEDNGKLENSNYQTSQRHLQEQQGFLLVGGSGEDSISADSSAEPCTSSAVSSSDSIHPSSLSSKRFFFSPCSTNSILEEGKRSSEKEEEEEDGCGSSTSRGYDRGFEFCRDSVSLSLNSNNPYWDFRSSMKEMVEAHGITDWYCLQDLLQCYLMLNEENTHGAIVSAFIDVVMTTIDGRESEKDTFKREREVYSGVRLEDGDE